MYLVLLLFFLIIALAILRVVVDFGIFCGFAFLVFVAFIMFFIC
jgi:hypothetical protein